jgi:hypothetical protein
MDVIPKTDPRAPVYLGRACMGTRKVINRKAPGVTPAPPIPVITRPTIKALDVGAVAQIIEPISKMAMLVMRAHFAE